MRIVLTVHQFLPDHLSGTELIAYHIARELQSRGHDVRIFTGYPQKIPLPESDRFDTYNVDGLQVHRFRHAHVPMGGQSNIVEMEYRHDFFKTHFTTFLKEFRPDVVHFLHLYRLSTTAIDACRELGIRTLFTATDFWFICPLVQLLLPDGSLCNGPNALAANCVRHIAEVSQSPAIASRIQKTPQALISLATLAARLHVLPSSQAPHIRAVSQRPAYLRHKLNEIDRVILPSKTMQTLLTAHGLEPERATLLPYGVPTSHLQRHTDKGDHPLLRVAFLGAMVRHKGPHVLIAALRTLPRDIPISVTFHGKLEEYPDYIASLRALAGDDARIRFAGGYQPGELNAILADTDLVVVPSLWYENTPLVIYEAHAAGTPVLASNLGGMAEAVRDGVDGLLFPPNDATALAALLQQLATDRTRIRALAAQTLVPMSVATHVNRLEALYAPAGGPHAP